MNETRKAFKDTARGLLREDHFLILLFTAFYLVATDWLTTFFRFLKENPMMTVMDVFTDQVDRLTQTALNSGTSSLDLTPAYTSAAQTARELLSQPGERIALFAFVLLFLYTVIVQYGYYLVCMKHLRRQPSNWQDLFSTLYLAGKIIAMEVLVTAAALLGLMFFFVPGVYLYYRYAMAPYCLLDHPEESIFQALRRSARMTRGHKLELLLCDVSFLGWIVAGMVIVDVCAKVGGFAGSVGASLLVLVGSTVFHCYFTPYRQLTFLQYYESFITVQSERTE